MNPNNMTKELWAQNRTSTSYFRIDQIYHIGQERFAGPNAQSLLTHLSYSWRCIILIFFLFFPFFIFKINNVIFYF